jgi:hypothetical protein
MAPEVPAQVCFDIQKDLLSEMSIAESDASCPPECRGSSVPQIRAAQLSPIPGRVSERAPDGLDRSDSDTGEVFVQLLSVIGDSLHRLMR